MKLMCVFSSTSVSTDIATSDGAIQRRTPEGNIVHINHYVHAQTLPLRLRGADRYVIEDTVVGVDLGQAIYSWPKSHPRAFAAVELFDSGSGARWKIRVEAQKFEDAKRLFDFIMYKPERAKQYRTGVLGASEEPEEAASVMVWPAGEGPDDLWSTVGGDWEWAVLAGRGFGYDVLARQVATRLAGEDGLCVEFEVQRDGALRSAFVTARTPE